MGSFIIITIWLILNILIGLTMDFALFTQTLPELKHQHILLKILTSEFWATIEWMFVIPANRIGNRFLNPAQLSLSSYVFDFLAQLWSNVFWLKIPIPLDDYIGMILIFIGMIISKLKMLG
jgi:uncharacterized protein (DUF486 family)